MAYCFLERQARLELVTLRQEGDALPTELLPQYVLIIILKTVTKVNIVL